MAFDQLKLKTVMPECSASGFQNNPGSYLHYQNLTNYSLRWITYHKPVS